MLDNRLTIIGKHVAYDYEAITVATTAIGLTNTKLITERKPIRAYVTVEGGEIRFRYDGTDPTASEGHILNDLDSKLIIGYAAMKNIKFIRTGTESATLRVTYER